MMARSDDQTDQLDDQETAGDEAEKLNLSIKVDSPSACQRHVTVTIPREDIERYFDKAFSDLMTSASVPGFRAGRAPRKLVEARFRKDVADQVKGSLLMDSMTQITEDPKLSAISEPDFDPLAVELPDEGPMTFEFDLEVRPEFDLPEWKGLHDRAAGTRVQRSRRRQALGADPGRPWPAGAPRRSGRAGRLHQLQPDVQERRRRALQQPRKR